VSGTNEVEFTDWVWLPERIYRSATEEDELYINYGILFQAMSKIRTFMVLAQPCRILWSAEVERPGFFSVL